MVQDLELAVLERHDNLGEAIVVEVSGGERGPRPNVGVVGCLLGGAIARGRERIPFEPVRAAADREEVPALILSAAVDRTYDAVHGRIVVMVAREENLREVELVHQ